MAKLDSLIRVRKHTVDQKQKFLADLYRQAEALDLEKEQIEQQLRIEQDNVKNMGVEMLNFFGAYSKAVKARIEEIDAARAKLETRINFAREDMRLAFSELKKIEIIQERRKAEKQKEIAGKETRMLDDIGIEGFRKQEDRS